MKSANPDPERFVTAECWKKHTTNPEPAHEPAPRTGAQVQLHTNELDTHETGFGIRKDWAGHP